MKPLHISGLSIPTALACMILCVVCVSGCGPKLATRQSIGISPNDIRTILIDPISQEQTVTVEATGSGPFSIHAHLAGDEDAVDTAVTTGKESPKVLALSKDQSTASLEFVVPAEKQGALRFSTNGDEEVTVEYTISN